MSKDTKYIVVFIVFSLLFGVTYFAYELWKTVEETAYLACIASIADKVQKSEEGKNLAGQNTDWKILSENEVDSLMSNIQGGDCKRFPNKSLDSWSRKINIALRNPKDRIQIMIWSNGRDGISGTDDDLVIPWGEKAPK